jgi:putative iron-dependent peroxidase
MTDIQPGILAPIPPIARYLCFNTVRQADPRAGLHALAQSVDGYGTVVGVGASLVQALGATIDGLVTMPAHSAAGLDLPSTPCALWVWLRGAEIDDRGALLHRARAVEHVLGGAFELSHTLDAFRHGTGRDLTGYEDGTENPTGDAATQAATVRGQGRGLDGGSFVAVQQWQHDFAAFDALPARRQDDMVGRRKADNEELEDAPPSAHAKRTAQESFSPQAFLLRRSMPWADGPRAGLHFVAFGSSFYAFEAQLRRMLGAEDGITDALFTVSRPVNGSYFWCPPMDGGVLDLSALSL